MAVDLTKGQRIVLDHSMRLALIGLGWDTNRCDRGTDLDLDASAFLLGENNRLLRDEDFVFYNNLNGRDGAVIHTGDNRTGDGEGDENEFSMQTALIVAEIYRKGAEWKFNAVAAGYRGGLEAICRSFGANILSNNSKEVGI